MWDIAVALEPFTTKAQKRAAAEIKRQLYGV